MYIQLYIIYFASIVNFVVTFRVFHCHIPRFSLSLSATAGVPRAEKRAAPAPASTARLGEQYY